MKYNFVLLMVVLACTIASPSLGKQVLERDSQNEFTVSRPASWVRQERPMAAIRVMLGIEGDGYVGNCNIAVLPSSSTVKLTQVEVDEGANKHPLPALFFKKALQYFASDVKVMNVRQVRRGPHYGHLVDYTYSYMSPSLNVRVYMRAELFSNSRPGYVYSFTCNTGALSLPEAQEAFLKERESFELFSSSFRIEGP